MVKLLGANHGLSYKDILGNNYEHHVEPTAEMQAILRSLPRGTRIGLEAPSPEIFTLLLEDLREKFRDYEGAPPSNIGYSGESYFNQVRDLCAHAGHEIVWLENENVWRRYNERVFAHYLARERMNLFLSEEYVDERERFRKLVRLEEDLYAHAIRMKETHLLERDELMLQSIAALSPRVAFAGVGHTDYWAIDNQRIRDKIGIIWESYAADDFVHVDDPHAVHLVHYPNRSADPYQAHDFTLARRKVRLLEKGMLSDAVPDWVGTWDVEQPSRGYFEVFVDEENGRIMRGRIEDLLGTADFEGEFSSREIKFTKKYRQTSSHCTSCKGAINYHAFGGSRDLREQCHGTFSAERCGTKPFYLEKPSGLTPFDMAMAWEDLSHDSDSGQGRLF